MESSIKVKTNQFQKMSKDIANSKYPENLYFDARNIRLLTHKEITTGGFEIEKSNLKIFNIGEISFGNNSEGKYIQYNSVLNTPKRLFFKTEELDYLLGNSSSNQKLVGYCNYINGFILITSGSTSENGDINCIWRLEVNTLSDEYNLELLYVRDLKINTENIVQVLSNFENENIYKIYFIDGFQQIYHLNINQHNNPNFTENLIDVKINNIKAIGEFSISQPEIVAYLSGGTHTAGKVQYAYNLYNLNGSQTNLSSLSEFAILDNTSGGGDENEVVNNVPQIKISNIDTSYSNIRIYSIKYTSFNVTPVISLIVDEPITTTDFLYSDFGRVINTISLEEFIFLGSNFLIPKSIESKNNRLFLANYKEREFDIDEDKQNIDFRAWSFPKMQSDVVVADSVSFSSDNLIPENPITINRLNNIINFNKIPLNHSTININYNSHSFSPGTTEPGAEGPFLELRFKRELNTDAKYLTYKDGEIYRFAIQFYNKYGLYTTPKWITDYKIPDSEGVLNLNDWKIYIELTLKQRFYDWLNDDNNFLDENGNYDDFLKPVGYKLLRADRTILDRTIICQGILNGMMSQIIGDRSNDNGEDIDEPGRKEEINRGIKLPSLMRAFNNSIPPMRGMQSYLRLDTKDYVHPELRPGATRSEVQTDANKNASQWQFNNMVQMFSPEITFNYLSNISNCYLNFKGSQRNSTLGTQNYEINLDNLNRINEVRLENSIFFEDKDVTIDDVVLNSDDISLADLRHEYDRWGLISKQVTGKRTKFVQHFRKYTDFQNFNANGHPKQRSYLYADRPEITEVGQGRTALNNQPLYTYYNTWEVLSGDQHLHKVNTWGAKCLTMALRPNNSNSVFENNLDGAFFGLENYKFIIPHGNLKGSLIGELVISDSQIYSSNIYGGNSIASKKRTNYIEIGKYNDISNNISIIKNSGDTYVQDFKFTKLVKTDTEVLENFTPQYTEIVEFKVETSIDLTNRKDISNGEWYSRLQPRYDEFQKYNLVYSQQPNLIVRRDYDYKFLNSGNKDNSIISSKQKISGEFIDSWLDFLVNDILLLDGRYGKIRNLILFNDNLYSIQDFAISLINIEPRVQVQGSDGIGVELGKGEVLDDYKYITTSSGSCNKWASIATQFGIIYIDLNNKALIIIGQDGIRSLSEEEGFHKEFLRLLEDNNLQEDKPLINKGVVLGFNKLTNDLFISVFTENTQETLVYNFKSKGFTSYYDYNSKFYMDNKSKMITINHDNDNYMEFHGKKGHYGEINEQNRESYIEFVVNPEPEVECSFNNIEYKSESYDMDDTESRETWDKIEVHNEFQEGSALIDRNNSRMLNRKWRINIPRSNRKHRIRNTWCNIKLTNFNESNNRLLTHNISTYYIPHYKLIQ